MRNIVGVLAPGDFPQGRWACNVWLCDDAYDAASQAPDLLIVDAHGWEDPHLGWVVELDGIHPVEQWVQRQPENRVFLNVCNPARRRIKPRPGQTVVYLSVVSGPGSVFLDEVRG